MMFDEAYIRLYSDLLSQVAQYPKSETLCGFMPLFGSNIKDCKKRFLVVGRAVNDWDLGYGQTDNGWQASQMLDDDLRMSVLNKLISESTSLTMDRWIQDARLRRSSFWRTTRGIASNIANTEPQQLGSSLAWTNLYKVSPATGGNPSDSLCLLQLESCRRLFEAEVKKINPTHILLITGEPWSRDFVPSTTLRFVDSKLVDLVGSFAGAQCVVTKRPERRPEHGFVEEVTGLFS